MLQYTARITSTDAPRVGGRNLIVTSRWKAGYLYGDRDENAYPVGSENYKVLVRYDKFRFDPVYIPTLGESKVTYKLYDNGGDTAGNVQIHAYDKDKKFLWWSVDSWKGTVGRTVTWTLPTDTAYIRLGVTNENVRAKVEFGTVATDWTPAPEDVAESVNTVNTNLTNLANTLLDPEQGEIHKLTSLLGKHKQDTDKNFEDLDKRSFTTDQKRDLDYLTNSLQVLRSAGNNTLEGLALQRLIALSGNGKDISAYIASDSLTAVLKAGITNFGTPQEREQVEITHQGSGHFGNLYFAGDTIDFRTSQYTDPYLSIGAEEATFIETFLKQARLDDTPVTVSTINLTPTSTGYQRTITTNNDGTRLTITLDRINIATFDNSLTRLTLDGETLAEWRGTLAFREEYRNGILTPVPVYKPYEATGLTYERVVRAGTHTLRLQIINPQSPYTATINGLKVRRRYDTGAQQSLLTKSGLRLFGSPDRYLDVDYRQRYSPGGNGSILRTNPYLLRIKGGAKIDKLTAEEIDMPGVPLCGATFDEGGGQINSFGAKAKQQGYTYAQAYRAYNADFYRVYHSIGHTNYIPVLQVYGLSNGNYTQCLTTRIDAIEANSFAVRIVTTGNVSIKHSFSYVAFKTTV